MLDVATNTAIELAPIKRAGNYCWMDNEHVAVTGDGQVWVASREGTQVRAIAKTRGSGLSTCSPKYVITDRAELVNTETNEVSALPEGVELGEGFSSRRPLLEWLTGDKLLFSRGANNPQIKIEERGTWLYDISTKGLTRISPFPFIVATVLPDGKTILFVANETLWRANSDGSDLKELASLSNASYDVAIKALVLLDF